MMHDGAVRRHRNRVGIASGAVTLSAAAAVAVAAFGTGTTPPSTSSTAIPHPTPGTAPTSTPPKSKDQIVVLGSGTFQGRNWRLVRDRFIIDGSAGQNSPTDFLADVDHLPFSDYGKSGTAACEALGLQFGDAAPGSRPAYDVQAGCVPQAWNPDLYAAPRQFVPSSFSNGSNKATGDPTYVTAIGYGPAAGFDGATAVSATLTIDGVTGERQPLLKAPGENTAYYAFLVPGTRDGEPKATVTFYNAQGKTVGTANARFPSAPTK